MSGSPIMDKSWVGFVVGVALKVGFGVIVEVGDSVWVGSNVRVGVEVISLA